MLVAGSSIIPVLHNGAAVVGTHAFCVASNVSSLAQVGGNVEAPLPGVKLLGISRGAVSGVINAWVATDGASCLGGVAVTGPIVEKLNPDWRTS